MVNGTGVKLAYTLRKQQQQCVCFYLVIYVFPRMPSVSLPMQCFPNLFLVNVIEGHFKVLKLQGC